MHAHAPERTARRAATHVARTVLAGFVLAGALIAGPAALGLSDEAAAQAYRPRCAVNSQEWGRAGVAIATGNWGSAARHATTAQNTGTQSC